MTDADAPSRPRTVIRTALAPRPDHVPADALTLTGHPRAAAAVGVPHVSLAAHAARVLREARDVEVAGRLDRWRTLSRAIEATLHPPDPAGVRRVMAGPVAELVRVGLDTVPDAVLEEASPSRRARDAVRVARRYRDDLAERGRIDPAERLRHAARVLRDAPGRPPLAVLGASVESVDFVDAAAGPGSVVVLGAEADEAIAALASRGWRVRDDARAPVRPGERAARAFLRGGPSEAGPRAYAFASEDEQLRWFLGRAKALLRDGVPARDVVLAVPDGADLADRAEEIAREYGVPLRAEGRVRLAHTRLGGWVAALLEVVRRGAPYEETARLLAHRLTGGSLEEVWHAVRAARPEGVEAWARFDPRAAHLDWPREEAPARSLERFDATLAAFGLADEAALGASDAAALRTLRDALAGTAGPEGEERTRAAFARDVDDLLRLLTVRRAPRPAPGDEDAVEVLGLRALAGAAVPHLFVANAVEGALPAALRDDPVLDVADRARLAAAGVPIAGATERVRDEEAVFAALLRAGTGEILFGVPSRVGGRGRLPSPYLDRLGLAPEPAPARPPASIEERRRAHLQHEPGEDPTDPVLAHARHAWRVERRRESAAPADAYDGVTGRGRVPEAQPLSATQIAELGGCPFRWFAHRILDVHDPEEADETITPRLRGLLWHAALERAAREGARRAADPADGEALREAIVAALPRAFGEAERAVGVPASPAWDKAREAELRALVRAVRAEAFVSPGAVPSAFERPFRGRWRGLSVRGVVDRIDDGPGGAELVDYKTGTRAPKGAKDGSGRGWTDVQLPLYLEAAAPELLPGRPPAVARYLSLRTGETLREARPGANEAALAELAARVRGHLAAGAYPVDPDPQRAVCATCDLASVCRVGPRVDRKRDAAREARGADEVPA